MLLGVGCAMNAMQPENKLIEFQGEKKYLLGWILASQLDPKHRFSTTSIVRLAENTFTLKGDVLNMNEQDIQDVGNNNCVYCSYYTLQKTRLSQGTYAKVGAIILGTKDEKACKDLHFASMRSMIAESKK